MWGFGYRREHRATFVLAFVGTLALALALGCASGSTPMRKGYTTISDATAGAKAAMGAFNDRYQAGLQTEADRTLALQAWATFQAAVHVAETIAKDPNRTADPMAVASDAAAKLITFLAALLPKKTEIPLRWIFEPPLRFALLGGAL